MPFSSGLSPRMRGNPLRPARGPAHSAIRTVYPRACGGTHAAIFLFGSEFGLSPRMRGNLSWGNARTGGSGSIPAHAGEPAGSSQRLYEDRVYPRACGGTPVGRANRSHGRGLSPRMRGNPRMISCLVSMRGSIPAHAGEPSARTAFYCSGRVYPRACGGTPTVVIVSGAATGLSPRMRGNLEGTTDPFPSNRSIPAHAGEPRHRMQRHPLYRVYPRACGGTRHVLRPYPCACGLSPRMRGNPTGSPTWKPRTKVYPRACGGTVSIPGATTYDQGLSPRMRGNHQQAPRYRYPIRSIPAHAGEPMLPVRLRGRREVYPRACGEPGAAGYRRRVPTVYPRACGGTASTSPWNVPTRGLSPRMRGNRVRQPDRRRRPRSIPAHAGEPGGELHRLAFCTVYPRACGGTIPSVSATVRMLGLSPRMRGNPFKSSGSGLINRSIPAHAGEPRRLRRHGGATGVYPRACGGTDIDIYVGRQSSGLSPRMRGNLRLLGRVHHSEGSIPAHAGEPSLRWSQ